ncbi:MAG: diacylglycerol kinase family lipid kinase, partial [Lachnospiraceae bacterium]|nr:diacylglycerol kinase family lipid kinase [Lachnospiraceae bacterium]
MVHFVINPASRGGKGKHIWNKVLAPAMETKQIPYEVHFSSEKGDIARICAMLEKQDDSLLLIIVGGDGSLNEALSAITDHSKVTFGYIPSGSGNDFARDMKMSQKPLEVLNRILHTGNEQRMDLGIVEYPDGKKRCFAISCGIGFDAAVCEELQDSKLKRAFSRIKMGKLAYLCMALKQLLTAKRYDCELLIDQKKTVKINRMLFLTGMIHRYEGGGFLFCPMAQSDDGMLDLCVVGNVPRFFALLILPLAFWGKHYISKHIHH